jgi:hypothetical protein
LVAEAVEKQQIAIMDYQVVQAAVAVETFHLVVEVELQLLDKVTMVVVDLLGLNMVAVEVALVPQVKTASLLLQVLGALDLHLQLLELL